MAKDQQTNLDYQGDSPSWAATKQFVASTAFWGVGIELAIAGVTAAFSKSLSKDFIVDVARNFQRNWKWELPFALGFGAWDAKTAYDKTAQVKAQHDKLRTDNKAMRSQLNQTGQILNHVADQIGKGKIADSQLSVSEDAPPSHVARLEAQKAAEAAQAVLSK